MGYQPSPDYWTVQIKQGKKTTYVCKPCNDHLEQLAHRAREHEQTQKHQEKLKVWQDRQRANHPGPSQPSQQLPSSVKDTVLDDAVRALLVSCSSDPSTTPYPPSHPALPPYTNPHQRSPSPVTGIDWNLLEALGDTQFEHAPLDQALSDAAQASLNILNGAILSDDEWIERASACGSDAEDDSDQDAAPSAPADKRARNFEPDAKTQREWYPWLDRIKAHNKLLQTAYGIETVPYVGAMGDRYYVNNLSQILAQEMANPRVRHHISFYPEDSHPFLGEARQGAKWLHEMPSELTTPMIRVGKDDFYIFEPTMLTSGMVCVPHRWFTRNGLFYAKAWTLHRAVQGSEHGWEVWKHQEFEVSQHDLLKNFLSLKHDYGDYGLPDPTHIFGVRTSTGVESWDYTKPESGFENAWRGRAKGRRVVALPLWLYCDDTSGNVSKKWNEHNSYLFTLAGLPREQVAKEYNVHFLCTSNIAPPIEMLDSVEDQIRQAQENGIWAWDCCESEPVLGIPSVLAFLGDNPMQSEFACHIGMNGKYFCRGCWVKTSDAEDVPVPEASGPTTNSDSKLSSDVNSSDSELLTRVGLSADGPNSGEESEASNASVENENTGKKKKAPAKKRVKKVEDLWLMIERVTNFIKPGRARRASETRRTLDSYTHEAKQLYSKTKLKKARTNTGIKDTHQEHFLERLIKAGEGCSKRNHKSLDDAIAKLPSIITSPVWRISGLDPHIDTPVEILHVGLLGFVKYFWRDVVQNQLKGKDAEKELLMRRLSDLDVSGLGISRLNGKTLVQYCGSLTGRDFRAIAQCAPFCIFDMVSTPCFAAWQAMSSLVPLIWQPVIENVNEYLNILCAANTQHNCARNKCGATGDQTRPSQMHYKSGRSYGSPEHGHFQDPRLCSHDGLALPDDVWQRSRMPYPPSITSGSYPSSPSPPQPPSQPVSQPLAPVFVDNTGRSLNLRTEQISHLKIIYKLGVSQVGLSVPELTTAIYSAALQLASENRILTGLHDMLVRAGVLQGVDEDDQTLNVRGMFKELKIRLEDSFRFTKEQSKNLRLLTQMQIYKHSRILLKELHVDIEAKVFESKELYNMGNVVGNPSRKHPLTSEEKRKASHVRNQFRTDLKKSVVGPTACSLDDFCVRCATKYRAGISAAADQKYIIRNALLVHFQMAINSNMKPTNDDF
ncbi:hypothetical protein D9619_011028 [Psilocybe cf. subviscida]|uniref:C2H2-type domain-containing protein n=1 Tax=Psilocybe cf. subviscida TaxID=2480587 RepID=A0A8H5F0G4_9AGAR|nr:hypothetical protein D9619_011028 [Psilocybe cf. subviscida]